MRKGNKDSINCSEHSSIGQSGFFKHYIKRGASVLLTSFLLAGTFGAWTVSAQESEIETESETETAGEPIIIGTESNEEGVRSFRLKNMTGLDILYLSVKDASMVAFEDNYLEQDEVFEDKEEAVLYYDARQKEEPFLVALLFDGDVHTQAVMHALPWDAGEGELVLSESSDIFGNDKVAYVRCQAEDGTEILTEEGELEAYKNGGNMFLLPDPEKDGEKDANEGCVGEDALFN